MFSCSHLVPSQSFVMAPLFVWLELLFALGYRPKLRHALEEATNRSLKAKAVKSTKEKK
jgi:uncharacterized membrane protein YGL010W